MYDTNTAQCELPGRIDRDKVVRLRFWARDRSTGELLQFGDDLTYLHGGYGGVFPKVETGLDGLSVADRIDIDLPPGEGYGERRNERLITQPRQSLPDEELEIGMVLEGELPDGSAHPFVITSIDEESVTLDGNHPWAGRHLAFTFEILEVRDSVPAERAAGFPFHLQL